MWSIDHAYIDGAFVPVQGSERLEIANPATEQPSAR
jgi:aldehyde dehydrogenase (NAD+)